MIVDIPGLGQVEFPDSMSDADVASAIQRMLAQQQPTAMDRMRQAGLAGAPDTSAPMNLLDPVQGSVSPLLDTVSDVGMAAPSGLLRGAAGLADLPALAPQLAGAALDYMGYNGQTARDMGLAVLPPPGAATQGMSDLTGGFSEYEPTTRAGNFAGTMAEFVPGAIGGGGLTGILGRIGRYGLVPGAVSEGAGQLAEGSGLEGGARVLGGLLGGMAMTPRYSVPPGAFDRLRAESGAIYDAADAAAPMSQNAFAMAANRMLDNAYNAGLDATITPQSSALANNIADVATTPFQRTGFASLGPGGDISFRQLDMLRRQASVPAMNLANKVEAAIGTNLIGGLDDFIESASPAMSATLVKARDMWARLRRSDIINAAIERAQNQSSGFENGLRLQFRSILDNPRLSRGFQPAELAAIKSVVRGTTFGNALRLVGKFGIGLQQNTNAVGASLGAGAGAFLSGGTALGAIAVPAVGSVARAMSEAAARRQAEGLLGLLATGTPIARPGMAPYSGNVSGILANMGGPQ